MTLPALTSPLLDLPGIQHAFFTRQGGVSTGIYAGLNVGRGSADEPADVAENRRRAAAHFGLEPQALSTCYQIHSATALSADRGWGDERPQGDAVVTATPHLICGALAADCAPILLADPSARIVASAHAGWKGLAAGVLEATLQKMQSKRPSASGWRAWVGPGIGAKAFQVGDEVRVAFNGAGAEQAGLFLPDPLEPGKWRADLAGLACWRLAQMGVSQVENSGLCTVNDPAQQFFSYRRDRVTGRMATLAWLS